MTAITIHKEIKCYSCGKIVDVEYSDDDYIGKCPNCDAKGAVDEETRTFCKALSSKEEGLPGDFLLKRDGLPDIIIVIDERYATHESQPPESAAEAFRDANEALQDALRVMFFPILKPATAWITKALKAITKRIRRRYPAAKPEPEQKPETNDNRINFNINAVGDPEEIRAIAEEFSKQMAKEAEEQRRRDRLFEVSEEMARVAAEDAKQERIDDEERERKAREKRKASWPVRAWRWIWRNRW